MNTELERLLNIGQYSSGNPVVARVGLYVEPIISAAHSGLCLSRVIYNIVTWRDPILSFWISLLLLAATLILAVFPWRLFLFVTGLVIMGPQNFVLRIMHKQDRAPKFLEDFLEKQKNRRKRKSKDIASDDVPRNQPIISCHTSDNTPPAVVTFDVVQPSEVHEVCVPYSQLMHHRMYDWPPEGAFSRCEPTAEVERRANRTRTRAASVDTLRNSYHHRQPSTGSISMGSIALDE